MIWVEIDPIEIGALAPYERSTERIGKISLTSLDTRR